MKTNFQPAWFHPVSNWRILELSPRLRAPANVRYYTFTQHVGIAFTGLLRHIAGTAWSTKRYLNIKLLKDQQMRGVHRGGRAR
jgi:hypothetical protein